LAAVNTTWVTVTDVTDSASGNPTSVNIVGESIDFAVPAATGTIQLGNTVEILIQKVKNPGGGTYSMVLDYELDCCDPVDFCTVTYKIKPAYSDYGLMIDFGDTYPGIAKNFVPPFKACGQNDSLEGPDSEAFNTTYNGTVWFSPFDLVLVLEEEGCALPCTNMTLFVDLVASPTATAKASFNMSLSGPVGPVISLNSTSHNYTFTDVTLNMTPTGPAANKTAEGILHFDTKGDYSIYFKVFCPPSGTPSCETVPPCEAGAEIVVAEETYDFSVYQWKNAFKLTLDEKWNLVSLPLVPLVDPPVEDTLASIPAADLANIMSIWHYDRCSDEWFVWPTPAPDQQALAELVDGEGYWVYVKYPQGDCGNITWWVWGTKNAMPPEAPAQYPVCEGWNQIGFTSLYDMLPSAYLWNWNSAPYPVVYGWGQGCWTAQTWSALSFGGTNMTPSSGYWVAFPAAGAIYVP
jgi:hypothetical protein